MNRRSPSTDTGGRRHQHEPVPELMAGCPIQGGRAVPAVALRHRDPALPAVFGIDDPDQINACLMERLCTACQQPLDLDPSGTYLLLVRPFDFWRGYSSQPAQHPACHDYSIRACPWLNGQMSHYRRTPRDLESLRCGDPGCGCSRWRTAAEHRPRAGDPVPPVFAATYALKDYQLDWGEKYGHADVLRGIRLDGVRRQAITPVRDGEWSLMDWMYARAASLPAPASALTQLLELLGEISSSSTCPADAVGNDAPATEEPAPQKTDPEPTQE
ncbi:hypothetical protein [Nonomuraea sp. NPDC049400]|uniref:hypothetical protein n=1 Tax=Nonomuraea sp. NPDC049400 TaxID=3364352 RepID=UPI00379CAB8E